MYSGAGRLISLTYEKMELMQNVTKGPENRFCFNADCLAEIWRCVVFSAC
jgi:hypothetical protein